MRSRRNHYRFSIPDAKTPDDALKIALDFNGKFKNDPLVVPAIAPHTLYTVPEDTLKKVAEESKKGHIRVMLHIAEMPKDQNKHPEKDNIYYLKEVGLLNDRVTLAHAIHLDSDQLKLLAQNNVGVSYNPMANAKGATGIADAYEMLKLAIPVGLGTDGPMSSNQLSMIPVLSYAANMQRILHMDRTIMTPEKILYMATLGGAKALI
jgi:cytosine/adenosine deaminase-related metal-dependent hydrolase